MEHLYALLSRKVGRSPKTDDEEERPEYPSEILRTKWESYVRVVSAKSKDKCDRLEEFLHTFLVMTSDISNSPDDLRDFSNDTGSVCNILAREFLSDVHNCCTSTECSNGDTRLLMDYLLYGRGWLLLNALNELHVVTQTLSCTADLANLLVALIPLLLKVPVVGEQSETDGDIVLSDVSVCFTVLKTNPCFQPPYSRKHTSLDSASKSGKKDQKAKAHSRETKKRASSSRARRRLQREKELEEDKSTDTDDNMSSFLRQKKSHSFPMLTQIASVGNADSYGKGQMSPPPLRDSELYSRMVPLRPLHVSQDDGKVLTELTSPVDLCLVLMSLLEKLSNSEITNPSHRSTIAISLIPQLVRLSTLLSKFPGHEEESRSDVEVGDLEVEFAEGWQEDTITVLQRVVLRVILKMCAITCLRQNGCSALSSNGTLTSVLELAIDINNKISLTDENGERPPTEGGEDLENAPQCKLQATLATGTDILTSRGSYQKLYFVCEVVQGLLLLISSIMQNLPLNLTFMSQTLHLLHEFSASQGYLLYVLALSELEECLAALKSTDKEYHEMRDFIAALVSNLTKVISAVKKAKVEYIHIMTCVKRKHRKCEFSRFMHHHHNVCGLSCATYEETSQSCDSFGSLDTIPGFLTAASAEKCCVASAVEVLLNAFERSSCKFTLLTVLSNLDVNGICCCMPPQSVISPLLNRLCERPASVRTFVLNFINKVVLEQLGGGVNIPTIGNEACNVCSDPEPQTNRSSFIGSSTELMAGSYPDNLDSAIGSDASTHDEEQHTKWRVLSKYKDLLLSDDESLSVPVAKHLLHLVSHGNPIIKKVLFLHVFLPSFEVAKATSGSSDSSQRRPSGKELMSMAVLEHCFNALPPLLTSSSAQELFLTHGGLRQLQQLLYHDSTRSAVLRVFEVLIMAEDQKIEIQLKKSSYPRDSLLSSGEVRIGRLSESSNLGSYEETVMRGTKSSVSSGVSVGSFGVIDAFLEIVIEAISCCDNAGHESLDLPTSDETTDKEESISSATTSTTDTLEFVNSGECTVLSTSSPSERKISVQSLTNLRTNSLDRKVFQSGLTQALESLNKKSSSLSALKNIPADQHSMGRTTLPSLESSSMESTQTLQPGAYGNVILNHSDTEIEIAADIWKSCKNLYLSSATFKDHFLEIVGASSSRHLLKDTVSALSCYKAKGLLDSSEEFSGACKRCKSGSCECSTDRLGDLLSLLESLLAICLDCAAMSKENLHTQASVEAELAGIKVPLLESGLMQSPRGVEFCDALLHSGVLQKSNPMDFTQTTKTPQTSKLTVHFAPLSQDNVSDSSDSQSEMSDVCMTEAGYDADSERDIEDNRKRTEKLNSDMDTNGDEDLPQTVLLHPQICKLVLELLAASMDSGSVDVTCHGVRQLISIAKAQQAHSTALYYDGLATCLLDVFSHVLTTSESEFDEIRSLLLELFVVLVKHSISLKELRTFIQFMQTDDAPLHPLLSALSSVAGNMTVQPSHILCFPTTDPETYDKGLLSKESSLSASSPVFEEVSSPVQRQEMHPLSLLESPWGTAPLHLPINDSLCWQPASREFSISLWMRVDGLGESENTSDLVHKSPSSLLREDSPDILGFGKTEPIAKPCKDEANLADSLHVFSVGTKDDLFQTWYNPGTNNLVLRLVEEVKDKKDIVFFEKFVGRMLIPSNWQHLAMSYSEKSDGNNTSGQITIIIDGHHRVDVLVDYKAPTSTKSADNVYCLLGHYKKKPDVATVWQMSNMMMFSDAVMNLDYAYHLYTLGPDCCSLIKCEASKQTANYEMSINEDILDAGLSSDLLTGATDMDTKALRESMVVTYSPRNTTVFSLYQIHRPLTRSVSIVSNILPSTNKPSSLEFQHAIPVQANTLTELVPSVFRGLQSAVYEVGGMAVFMYMFAKVVERSRDELTQSEALKLLLLLKSQNQLLAQEFKQLDGYGMVYRVLASSRCYLGQHMLKVLLDACCHGDSVLMGSSAKGYLANHNTRAVIRDKELVSELLLSWRLWYNGDPEIWETLLETFKILISEAHPYHEFNTKQLQCAKTVEKILLTCKELQSESLAPPPVSICKNFVSLVQAMMGSPPDLDIVIAICDFVLVVHPAINTFICHAPSSFYFTQHTGPQQEYKQKLIVSTTPSLANSPGSSIADKQSPRESPTPFVTSTPIKISRRRRHHSSIPEMPNEGDSMRGSDPGMPRYVDGVKKICKSNSFPTRKRIGWDDAEVSGGRGKGADASAACEDRGLEMKLDLLDEMTTVMGSPMCRFYLGSGSHERSDVSGAEERSCEVFTATREEGESGSVACEDSANVEGREREDPDGTLKAATDSSGKEESDLSAAGMKDGQNLQLEGGSADGRVMHTVSTDGTVKAEETPANDETSRSSSSVLKDFVVVQPPEPEDDPDAYLVLPEMETLSTSQLTETDCLSITADSMSSPPGEDGLEVMTTGLLKLLYDLVVNLPDIMVDKVVGIVIRPEILIVLAHHTSVDIRTAIVKLLDMFFHRASNDKIATFLKIKGFYLLANQLHQHGATRELIEACFTTTIGKPISLDADIDPALLQSCGKLKHLSVIPIMALVENCVHDQAVCHNTICLLIQLFDNVDTMAQVMLDNGLVEALCNVASAINKVYNATDPCVTEERQLLLGDIEHFLACVVVRSCSIGGLQPFQQLDDLITMLGILEDKEKEIHGKDSDAVKSVRKIRWYALREAMEHIQAVYKSETDPGLSVRGYHGYTVRKYYELKHQRNWLTASYEEKKPSRASALAPLRSQSVSDGFLMQEDEDNITDEFEHIMGRSHLSLAIQRRFSVMNDPSAMNKKLQLQKKERTSVSDTEALQRFQRLFILAVNLVIYSDCLITKRPAPVAEDNIFGSDSDLNQVDEERLFIEYLYQLLIDCVSTVQERTKTRMRKQWYSLLWSSRDVLRVQLGRLMVHMLSPGQDITLRCCAARIAHNPRANPLLKAALQSNLQHDHKVVLFLHELIANHGDKMSKAQLEDAKAFRVVLEKAGFMPFPLKPQSEQVQASLTEDMKMFEDEMEKNHISWRKQREMQERRQLHRLDGLAKEISHCAMEVTQKVVMNQNIQRKKLLEEVRHGMAKNMDIRKSWHEIIQQLTHERAVWYDPEYFPTSWQLDPTEGPARVRRRLQRAHLGLKAKYLIPEKRDQYKEDHSQPLEYLFEDCCSQSTDATVLISRTQTNEAIKNTAKCSNVTPSSETPGELLIGTKNVYFVGDDVSFEANSTWSKHTEKEIISLSWSYDEIREIHRRWYQLRDDGLEIFLTNGKTFLLAFEGQRERDSVYRQLMSMELPNLVELDNIGAITQAWKVGQMTNFEFLTQLNKIAGRTFNDLMQYPVFPFILADYTSDVLDLEKPKSFRNLLKPIAVQHKDMESVYVDRYKWLKEEFEKPQVVKGVELMPPAEPHHYGSHYSNSGTVLQYVVRLPPFTKMFLQYQDQHFDLPDRTFHSVGTAWRLSSRESPSDVKELVPEFFFLPEFLINGERFNFGHKQSGEAVDHVILPPWAKQDARLFILIHRQALESDYVSQHLHGWVDLVFGHKQKGKAAADAINVFHPATYFGLDVTSIEDQVKRRAIETMIKTYGQTPKQLFSNPHPQRAYPEAAVYPELSGIYSPGMFTHMVNKDSARKSPPIEGPMKQVKGLKWGNYVGSPTADEPQVCFTRKYKTVVAKLVAVPTGSVCGLAHNMCLFVMYAKEKGVSSIHSTDIEWSAILSWAHPDGIMRLKHKKITTSFLQTNTSDQITCCNSLSDCRQFFAGTAAGVVMAYATKYNPNRQAGVEIVGSRTNLYGHNGPITCLSVCTPYSIFISGSSDKTCIVWDLNRLCYIRSLSGHSGPVVATAVSDTMGDIVSASVAASGGSDLYLWTINGTLVSQVHCDSIIHSLAFSNAPEGSSVNVIAAGLQTGIVRLWSSWDLKLVREICAENFNLPIISLVFSYDCSFLYASNTEGKVVAWSKGHPQKQKIPRFITFLS